MSCFRVDAAIYVDAEDARSAELLVMQGLGTAESDWPEPATWHLIHGRTRRSDWRTAHGGGSVSALMARYGHLA